MKLDFKKENIQAFLFSRRYVLFAGLMVIIGLGIVILGVFAQISGLIDLVNANNTAHETTVQLQKKAKSLQEVNYLEEFSKSSQVDLALPSEKPLLQLITGVNSVAQQAGVSISDVTTSPGKLATQSAVLNLNGTVSSPTSSGLDDTKSTVNGVNILTIGMKARGSLAQINSFLDLIEKITPITQATRLKLAIDTNQAAPKVASGSAAPVTGSQYEAELELSTYYFSQPISVTIDTPLPSIGVKEEAFLKSLDTFQFPDYQKQQQIQGGGSTDLFGTSQ